MCLSISATVALGCLFAPKVYIVLFQPHKNVRHNVAAALNPQGQRGAGRPFLSRRSHTSGLVGAMNGNFASPSNVSSNVSPEHAIPSCDNDSHPHSDVSGSDLQYGTFLSYNDGKPAVLLASPSYSERCDSIMDIPL